MGPPTFVGSYRVPTDYGPEPWLDAVDQQPARSNCRQGRALPRGRYRAKPGTPRQQRWCEGCARLSLALEFSCRVQQHPWTTSSGGGPAPFSTATGDCLRAGKTDHHDGKVFPTGHEPRNGPPADVPTDQPARPWRTEGLPKGRRSAPRRRWVTTAIWFRAHGEQVIGTSRRSCRWPCGFASRCNPVQHTPAQVCQRYTVGY